MKEVFALFPKKKKKKKKSRKLSHMIGIVLAIIVLAELIKTHGIPVHALLGGGSGVHSTSLSGTLDCSQLEQLWEDAGGSGSTAFTAAEIARAESSGRQYATDDDGNGTIDYGLWQINTVNGGSSADYNELTNARAAVSLETRDGWSPWVTYHNQSYIGQCQ